MYLNTSWSRQFFSPMFSNDLFSFLLLLLCLLTDIFDSLVEKFCVTLSNSCLLKKKNSCHNPESFSTYPCRTASSCCSPTQGVLDWCRRRLYVGKRRLKVGKSWRKWLVSVPDAGCLDQQQKPNHQSLTQQNQADLQRERENQTERIWAEMKSSCSPARPA